MIAKSLCVKYIIVGMRWSCVNLQRIPTSHLHPIYNVLSDIYNVMIAITQPDFDQFLVLIIPVSINMSVLTESLPMFIFTGQTLVNI